VGILYLKVGTLTPIYKNKGLMTESKNSREITITPPLSKIIETILKFRIKGNWSFHLILVVAFLYRLSINNID
jgi:hypothetical protein